MSPQQDERTIGRLEAHVEDLRAEVRAMRQDIAAMKALVEQARGARWLLTAAAAVAGGITALAAEWAAFWKAGP